MKCRELFLDTNYTFAEIDQHEYLLLSIEQDDIYNRMVSKAIPCEDKREFICNLAKYKWFDGVQVLKNLSESKAFKTAVRKKEGILNVVIYYRSITNGGAQRITAQVANLLAEQVDQQGNPMYKVILVTDLPTTQTSLDEEEPLIEDLDFEKFQVGPSSEYEINENVAREYLPSYLDSIKEKYVERYDAWENIISKHNIDVVISSLWSEPCTLWDMLTVKSFDTHPAFISFNHSFCCVPLTYKGDTAIRLMNMYKMYDGIVVLSNMDEKYVSSFNANTKYIPNPQHSLQESQPNLHNEKVIWVGRFSEEKRPLDAVLMMNELVTYYPKAKLIIVGTGDNEIINEVYLKIQELGLEENVELVGFAIDVDQYYKDASILISTSLFEGFPTCFSEAFSYGIPVVTYDMPWIAFQEDNRGLVAVPQNDYRRMASVIQELFSIPEKYQNLSKQAKEKYQEFLNYDKAHDWKMVIEDAVYSNASKTRDNELLRFMTEFQQFGKAKITENYQTKITELKDKNKELNSKLNRAYKDKSEINAKLQQTYKEKAERGLIIKQYQEKENKKLINRIKRKLK